MLQDRDSIDSTSLDASMDSTSTKASSTKPKLKPRGKITPQFLAAGGPANLPNLDKARLAEFRDKPLPKQAEILRSKWAMVGFTLLEHAERFARSVSKKDYGRLMQLLSSAGIAYDKVVPKGEQLAGITQINIFKGLPLGDIGSVLGKPADLPSPQPLILRGIAD